MSAILNDVSKTQLFIEVVLMNCVARRVNMSHELFFIDPVYQPSQFLRSLKILTTIHLLA